MMIVVLVKDGQVLNGMMGDVKRLFDIQTTFAVVFSKAVVQVFVCG